MSTGGEFLDAHRAVKAMTWDEKINLAKNEGWWVRVRTDALHELEREYAGTGNGISTSDVNHVAMSMIERHLIERELGREASYRSERSVT